MTSHQEDNHNIPAAITQVGQWSSLCGGMFTTISAAAFFPLFFDFNSNSGINYLCWLLVALSYLLMTVSNKHVLVANAAETSGKGKISNANTTKLFYADLAATFAIIYACYEIAVYYLQLTYLRRTADLVGKSLIDDQPGTPIFAIDLLGYFLLSVSTIFLALSLNQEEEKNEEHKHNNKFLKYLLFFHGYIGMTCIVVPALPMMYNERDSSSNINSDVGGEENEDDDDVVWQYVILSWTAQLTPICFMMAGYFGSFKKKQQKQKRL